MKHLLRRSFILFLVAACHGARAATYYVSPSGDDAAPGTEAAPFQTISHAAALLAPGDTCLLRAGTYRETVRPANSGTAAAPIVFAASPGEKVEVTGTDLLPATGWSVHSGAIYRISCAPAVTDLFLGGQHVNYARYPAETALPYDTGVWMPMNVPAHVGPAGSGTVAESFPDHAWDGATVVFLPDYPAWVVFGGTVTSSAGKAFSANAISWEWQHGGMVAGASHGYFTHALRALAAPGQWYYQDGALYLWAPDGLSPAGRTVEARVRAYAFDFNGRDNIQLLGVDVRAASLNLRNARNCLVRHCSVRFVTPYQPFTAGFNRDNHIADPADWEYKGVEVSGSGNTIDACYIAESYGDGLSVWGSDNTVENCLVEYVDRSLTDAACVSIAGPGHRLVHNTLRTSGRSIVIHRMLTGGTIAYNDLSESGLATSDLGVTYTFANDGAGTRISHNWIHDNLAPTLSGAGPGIYLDNQTRNYVIDHNVIWNCRMGVFVSKGDSGVKVYNNTLWHTGPAVIDASKPFTGFTVNNLASGGPFQGATVAANQLYNPEAPPLADLAGFNFQLRPGTAPVGAGTGVEGVPGPAKPDVGAYEVGAVWTAGTALTPPAFPDLRPSSPDRLTATQPEPEQALRLAWRNRAANQTGLEIYRRDEDTGVLSRIASLPADATGAMDATAVAGAYYRYQVVAVNAAGQSAGSVPAFTGIVARGAARRFRATGFDAMKGVAPIGDTIGDCSAGCWVEYARVDLGAAFTTLRVMIASPVAKPAMGIEVRLDSPDGPLLGTFHPTATSIPSDWNSFQEEYGPLATPSSGVHDLYFVFVGGFGVGNLEWFQLEGGRVNPGPAPAPAVQQR